MDIMPIPQRPIVCTEIPDMRDDILGMWDTVFDTERFRCAIRHAYFGDECNMRRTNSRQLNLLRLDEDRIRAKPLARLKRSADEFIVAHLTDIWLEVGDKWSLRPVGALRRKDAKPGFHTRFDSWKRRDRFKRPGVSFAPKAMHVCVHVFNARMTIVLLGKQHVEFLQSLQKIWVMIMRNAMLFASAHFIRIHTLFHIPALAQVL